MKHFRIENGAIVAGTRKENIPIINSLSTKSISVTWSCVRRKNGNSGVQNHSRRPTKSEITSRDQAQKIPAPEMVAIKSTGENPPIISGERNSMTNQAGAEALPNRRTRRHLKDSLSPTTGMIFELMHEAVESRCG